jgi:hypothetical protein
MIWVILGGILLLPLSAQAQTGAAAAVIDCGSATDSNFTGGSAFTIANPPAGLADTTLRYGQQFSYSIPVVDGQPYVVRFVFVEPCGACSAGNITGPGQRIFSVLVNDQPVLPNLDLWAVSAEPPGTTSAALVSIVRSVTVMPASGVINITFIGIVRTAVVSEIDITPLFQVFGGQAAALAWPVINTKCARCHGATSTVPAEVGNLDLTTRVAMLQGGNSGPAVIPGNPTGSLVYQAITRPPACLNYPPGGAGACAQPTPDIATLENWPAPGMPPGGPLASTDIAAIRTWIALGAP